MSEQFAKIDPTRAVTDLWSDAERYASLATAQGAGAACVTSARTVPIDDRVAMKCAVPTCFGYGTSANCPPNSPAPEKMRAVAAQYEVAVVIRVDVQSEIIVRDRATIKERVAAYKDVYTLVSTLESAAFYDGHYLALGLGAGSCKSTFCHDVDCAVLAGQKCRHSLIARPSMEAVGIDCFKLAAGLGWDIYPIGSSAQASCIPTGALLGLVFVG